MLNRDHEVKLLPSQAVLGSLGSQEIRQGYMAKELIKSAGMFGVMTLLSRIFGFIRDMVAAYCFGASPGYDAFILAFRIPNLMRRLFAEGAFSQAFVPVLADYQVNNTVAQTQLFIRKICGNLAVVLLVVSGMGMLAAPWVAELFAPGFAPGDERLPLAVAMLRITFPYIFFISLTALAGSILNSTGKFGAAAFTPIFLNLTMIIATLLGAKYWTIPEMAVAWAVPVAGITQLGFLLLFLRKTKFSMQPLLDWRDAGVRKVLSLMLPAVLGAAVSQINLLVDTIFASFLVSGSISWLYYSDRLMEFPLGIFGVGIATVVLPHLSKQHSSQSELAFSATLDWAIRWILLIGLPSTLGLLLLAGPLLATLFHNGRFGAYDVLMSRDSLAAYALSVVGIMLAKVLSSAFYARKNIKTPVYVSVATLLVNVVLNAVLITHFAHVGIALATSLASLFNALVLIILLLRRSLYQPQAGWWRFAWRMLVANTVLCVVITSLNPALTIWVNMASRLKICWLLGLIAGGVAIYSTTLLLCGVRIHDLIPREQPLTQKR